MAAPFWSRDFEQMSRIDDEVKLDFRRAERIGLDEAVFAEGKSAAQLDLVLAAANEKGASLLLTRLSADKLGQMNLGWRDRIDYCAVSRTGFFGSVEPIGPDALVALVAAGTSDVSVLREAERTLQFLGIKSTVIIDVGVAGLWRLTSRLEEIRRHPIVIAVAGMDAALPTVLGGLVSSIVIAVPTSVGYGVATGGHAALNAILSSCAPGITTVNIDNGYGAACAAVRALHAIGHRSAEQSQLEPANASAQFKRVEFV